MTDQQFYVAMGIPSAFFALNFLTVLGGLLWQAKRFEHLRDSLRSKIGSVRSDIDGVKSDIARVETVLGAKLDQLTARVKALEDEYTRR